MKTTGQEKLSYTVVLTAGVQKIQNSYRGVRLSPVVIFKNLKKPPKGEFPLGMVILDTKGGSIISELMKSSIVPKILMRRPW